MSQSHKPGGPAYLSRTIRYAFCGLPLLGCSALAIAQQSPTADKPAALPPVVVEGERDDQQVGDTYQVRRTITATRTDTPLRDVPQSITVVTEGLVRDQAMHNMGDVVRYVPGVQMAQGEGHRDAPILRGVTSTADFFVNGLRDDVQYLRDLYNVERVEVLKGPSGMIFGRGGTGGLINRVTKQADWSDPRELNLTLGSWDRRRLTGDFGHALNDALALRIAALYENSESFRDHVELDRWGVNPTLSYRFSNATSITVGYERFEDDRTVDRGVPSFQGRPLALDRDTFIGQPDSSYANARVDALTAAVSHRFGNGASLVNQTRYADYAKFYQNVYPTAYLSGSDEIRIGAYNNRTDRTNLINQTDLTFALRTGAVEHKLLVGAELSRQVTDNFRQTGYFVDVGPTATSDVVQLPNTIYTGQVEFRQSASDADNHSVATNAAIYVQDQIQLNPQWQIIAGLRYDRFDAELTNNRTGAELSSKDDLISPRLGVIYKPLENLSVYASYAVAHQPRAGEQLASLTATNQALEPEKFTNREVGVKWDVNPELSASAAVFRLDHTNVAVTDPDDATRLILVDGQRVDGLELSLAGRLTDAWQVMAGYAYQDGKLRTPGANNGNELSQVPEHSASLWNRYDFNPSWGVGLGVIWHDEVYVGTDNAVKLPSFTRVDAAVYYTLNRHVRLQLNVENLFDETYYSSAHNNNNITPGSPRAAYLGVNVRM